VRNYNIDVTDTRWEVIFLHNSILQNIAILFFFQEIQEIVNK